MKLTEVLILLAILAGGGGICYVAAYVMGRTLGNQMNELNALRAEDYAESLRRARDI